jgi:hypothetical protein
MHQCYKGMCHLNLSSSLNEGSNFLRNVAYQTTLRQFTADHDLNIHHCENSYLIRNNLRFTFTDMVEILWWLLVALFQEVYQLLATLWHQHKHCLHLAGCEGRTQCGSRVLPSLTCNILTDSCQTLLVSGYLHGNRKPEACHITSQVKCDLAVSKIIIN